jgi:hypothetical protein
MSYKLASYISLAFFFGVGLLFFLNGQSMPAGSRFDVGPAYFPSILSVMLMVACLAGLFTTWRRREDRVIDIPHPGRMFATLAVAVTFAVLWQVTGQFFPLAFVAVAALLFMLNPAGTARQKLVTALSISAILITLIYVLFVLVLRMRL